MCFAKLPLLKSFCATSKIKINNNCVLKYLSGNSDGTSCVYEAIYCESHEFDNTHKKRNSRVSHQLITYSGEEQT